MTRALLALSFILLSIQARADYGEIDLLVHESVANVFAVNFRRVDLAKLEYVGQPKVAGDKMKIDTRVWAEISSGQSNRKRWGWHDRTTSIKIKSPGHLDDRGSVCFFD